MINGKFTVTLYAKHDVETRVTVMAKNKVEAEKEAREMLENRHDDIVWDLSECGLDDKEIHAIVDEEDR